MKIKYLEMRVVPKVIAMSSETISTQNGLQITVVSELQNRMQIL